MRMTKATARLIERERVCRVATAGGRGMPHLAPVCQALAGGKIYFASGNDGRKAHLKGVMVQGRARRNPRGGRLDPADFVALPGTPERALKAGVQFVLPRRGAPWSSCALAPGSPM